jgi:hypothetical protein
LNQELIKGGREAKKEFLLGVKGPAEVYSLLGVISERESASKRSSYRFIYTGLFFFLTISGFFVYTFFD